MGKGKPGPTHHLNAPRRNCTGTNRAPDESVSPKPNTRPHSGPAEVLDGKSVQVQLSVWPGALGLLCNRAHVGYVTTIHFQSVPKLLLLGCSAPSSTRTTPLRTASFT